MISKNTRGRIVWIDIAKAITIILVIIGHTVSGNLYSVIFSFHIFLFFFLSAWTTRFSESLSDFTAQMKKGAFHLLLPALIAFALEFAFSIAKLIARHASSEELISYSIRKGLSLLFVGKETEFLGIKVFGFSVIWFLVVLFISKTIYHLLHLLLHRHRVFLCICCALLSLAGVFVGAKVRLFFSFDIALAVQIIFFLSQWFKEFYRPGESSVLKTALSLVVWAITLALPSLPVSSKLMSMSFVSRYYPFFPLCYVCALAGTLFVCQISWFISEIKLKKCIDAVCYLGKNSLYMLLVHYFDHHYLILYSFTENEPVSSLIRVAIDILVFTLVMWVRKKLIALWARRRAAHP